MTKEQKLIKYLKDSSPTQILMDIGDINVVANSDAKLIKDVRDVYQLPDEVINVLIQYVLMRKDMRFDRRYSEKLASYFAINHIKTAEQAFTLLKANNNG